MHRMTATQLRARRTPQYSLVSRTANEDRQYTDEELQFLMAMDAYKRNNQRPYPDCREVLAVFKSLGYRKMDSHETMGIATWKGGGQ